MYAEYNIQYANRCRKEDRSNYDATTAAYGLHLTHLRKLNTKLNLEEVFQDRTNQY